MAKLMLSCTNGSVGGGKRISKLLRNNAEPPKGNPVTGSRGPAWFNPKPRCELPPPIKNRSGSGISAGVPTVGCPGCIIRVLPNGFSTPTRVERANTSSLDDLRCFPKGYHIEF